MASISKRTSGAWQNTSYDIRATATDTITTLPTTIYGDGTNATVSVYGNTTQNGTPSASSPIMPQGTGERTGNLVRFYQEEMQDNFYGVDITVKNAEITLNGTVSSGSGHWIEIGYKFGGGTEQTDNVVIPCEPETSYTITTEILDGNSSEVRLISFGMSNTDKNININIGSSLTTMFSADINRIFISLGAGGVVFDNLKFRVMFNKGSTAKPYEPYGIKIPISSAGQTTPVYLGEVETTRKVKKLVLDGTETITEESTNVYSIPINDTVTAEAGLSTHFEYDSTVLAGQFRIEAGKAVFGYNDTLANFSTFLAAQYAAGTPVTVWYVLATPETAVVNEPLMRIGDYTDEVSGVSIPTTDGANTLSVDTTVQPSEASVNYHGWHMGTVHERVSGEWD